MSSKLRVLLSWLLVAACSAAAVIPAGSVVICVDDEGCTSLVTFAFDRCSCHDEDDDHDPEEGDRLAPLDDCNDTPLGALLQRPDDEDEKPGGTKNPPLAVCHAAGWDTQAFFRHHAGEARRAWQPSGDRHGLRALRYTVLLI